MKGTKKQIWILFEKATFDVGHLSFDFVPTDFRQIIVLMNLSVLDRLEEVSNAICHSYRF